MAFLLPRPSKACVWIGYFNWHVRLDYCYYRLFLGDFYWHLRRMFDYCIPRRYAGLARIAVRALSPSLSKFVSSFNLFIVRCVFPLPSVSWLSDRQRIHCEPLKFQFAIQCRACNSSSVMAQPYLRLKEGERGGVEWGREAKRREEVCA